MMKNVVVCSNCKSENPFYTLICTSCKSYMRERVYNIDLWKTISLLIESPSAGFKSIIFSEHKNFIILVILLAAGKLFIDGMFLSLFSLKENAAISNYISNYLIILGSTFILITLFSLLLKLMIKKAGIQSRFGDNLSIISYSFIPHAFGFLLLLPVELILFGGYLFSADPSPFIIKETLAYVMLGFEGLVILWSLFLTFIAVKTQSNNILFSVVFSVIIQSVLFLSVYFISINIFK
jgi:hypothetical protein